MKNKQPPPLRALPPPRSPSVSPGYRLADLAQVDTMLTAVQLWQTLFTRPLPEVNIYLKGGSAIAVITTLLAAIWESRCPVWEDETLLHQVGDLISHIQSEAGWCGAALSALEVACLDGLSDIIPIMPLPSPIRTGLPTLPDLVTHSLPVPNVNGNGRICLGSVPFPVAGRDTIVAALELFMEGSAFNHDNSQQRCRSFPENTLALWQQLDGKRKFPSAELVPARLRLGQLMS